MPSIASHRHIRAKQRRFRREQTGQSWSVKDLPQYYYHTNFLNIIDEIQKRYDTLLSETEQEFLQTFRTLPFYAQCIYIRLCARKGHIFHIDKIEYEEIDAIDHQVAELRQIGFVGLVEPADFYDYLQALRKPDLLDLLSNHFTKSDYKPSSKKSDLVDFAVSNLKFSDIEVDQDFLVQKQSEIVDYLLYLYSGQIDQTLNMRTMRELGLVKGTAIAGRYGLRFDDLSSAKSAFFYARGLHHLKIENRPKIQDLEATLDIWPACSCNQSLENKDKLLRRLGELSERHGNIEKALQFYSLSESAICNERLIRLKYKSGDKDWVKARLEAIIDDPSSDSESHFAEDFYARKFEKRRTSSLTEMLRKAPVLELDESHKHDVEAATLRHLTKAGLICFRTENQLWRALFGLTFWDILFPTDHTQNTPTDLKTGVFYDKNKLEIEKRLRDFDHPHLAIIKLLKTLTSKYGKTQNIFRWRSDIIDSLKQLIGLAPKDALSSILRKMAADWSTMRHGFPDIMTIGSDQIIKFLEIKAKGDVIRRNQFTRLKQLNKVGFRAEILKIDWIIDPQQTYVVVDVETTGGKAGLHRVTEIGAVKVRHGKIVDEWSSLINPQRMIPARITQITGITNEMVASAPVFSSVAESFFDFMEDAIFVAHNVNFDYGFIRAEYKMIDKDFKFPKLCTCSSMRKLYQGYASYSLKNLCHVFDINLDNHHRALCDAKAAAELLRLVNEKRLETCMLSIEE